MKKTNALFITLLFSAALTFMSSCSKEQNALNLLAGTWNYQTIKVISSGLSGPASTFGFEKLHFSICADFNTHCDGYIVQGGNHTDFQYDLNKEATQANVYNTDGSTNTYLITKLDKSNLVYTYGGYEFTLTK